MIRKTKKNTVDMRIYKAQSVNRRVVRLSLFHAWLFSWAAQVSQPTVTVFEKKTLRRATKARVRYKKRNLTHATEMPKQLKNSGRRTISY